MKSIEKIRKSLENYDRVRERIIQGSRKVIQNSKQAIYAMQRDDFAVAQSSIEKMRTGLLALKALTQAEPRLSYEGIYKVAIQEYVEALALYEFIKKGSIIPYSGEFVDPENYLMGLCDLSGELVRKAINASIRENYSLAVKIRAVMDELYVDLSRIDFKNGELRRKYDGIKYDLKKVDDLVFELKMKGKI